MADRPRNQWTGKLQFLFTSFGYTVGLGNIWRFPYNCSKHGGGSFFIPYFLTVFFCTVPMLFLETSLGQFSSQGPISVWKLCPLFKGVGWAIIFNIFMTNINYIVIVMYSFYYLLVAFVSIGTTPPWQTCDGTWNTELCKVGPNPDFEGIDTDALKIKAFNGLLNSTCVNKVQGTLNATINKFDTYMQIFGACKIQFRSPEEEYWNRFVLEVHDSSGFSDLGPVVGRNALALVLVWLLVYYCCMRGIQHLAKVTYLTATFPAVFLLVLLARGLTLSGNEIGIRYYTQADWSKLGDLRIWASAATQAMYSIGVAFGSHIALSSFNTFSNNLFRDDIILAAVNTATSILSGFVVFSFLGHASFKLNRPLDDIPALDNGPGMLFISYLQGISQMPGSSVWAFIFFLVVFTLGLDSVFVMVWTVHVAIEDLFPDHFRKHGKVIMFVFCLVPCLLGLPLVTKGGIHLFVVMEAYTANFTLTLFLILEAVVVAWIYGLKKFISDVEMMLGSLHGVMKWYLITTWACTAPAFGIFIFIAAAVSYQTSSYGNITTTTGGEVIGWLLTVTPFVIMIMFAGYQLWKNGGIRGSILETYDWSPRLEQDRTGRYVRGSTAYIHASDVSSVPSSTSDYNSSVSFNEASDNYMPDSHKVSSSPV